MVVERNAAYDVQEGIFHHEKFIKYQRAFEEAVLNPMLQPAQSPPAIELRTCNVSSRADDGVVQKLKDSLEQIRLSCARRAEEKKTPLLTRELQDELLDIVHPVDGAERLTIPLPEDRDVWQDVWTPAFEVQDDTVLGYREGE